MFYKEQIEKKTDLSVSDIIDVSNSLLPQEHRACPWKLVNHGVDLLSSDIQLCAYISAYAEMHWAKCRAAFQNFPFEDGLKTNFEVVDWGCGQGIATLSLIEMLRERDKLHLLRKVTLIEPSDVALNRAYINVDRATNHQIRILQYQKYLPYQDADYEIKGIEYEFPIVIHLFSNILDIQTINLEQLAKLVGREGRKHFVMCMGPTNSGAYRIDQFCSIFNVSNFISDITDYRYGYTSIRHKSFSCKTKCLLFENGTLSTINANQFKPISVAGAPIYDDYDTRMLQLSGNINEHIALLSDMLGNILNESDYLYIRPNINGDTPDIVVARPNRGIFLINVCTGTSDTEIKESVEIIKTYQENLVKLHIKDLNDRILEEKSNWALIKMMLYFPCLSTEEVKQIFKNEEYLIKYVNIQGRELFEDTNKTAISNYFNSWSKKKFDNSTLNSFVNIVSPKWHSFKQGKYIVLTNAQKPLAKSEAKARRKINGVAGSGKTQVLATRAVNAHLRTGRKVLVLTYNLTLVNYIKSRIGEVRADFSWDNIIVDNYHQFFKSVANNFGKKVSLESFESQHFFKEIEKQLPKYAAIFIDEVQDYRTEWLRILSNNFLEEDGEFVVFGDAKQNIYNRPIDANGQVRLEFISGGWNNSLNQSMRFANTQLANLAMDFQRAFFPNLQTDNIETREQSLDFDSCIKYWNINSATDLNTIMSNCRWIIQKFDVEVKDVVVLSANCETLRELDYFYKQQTSKGTLMTNETKEQFGVLKNDLEYTDFKFFSDLNHLRRSKRMHFTMDTDFLKLSTIHSYKGWEAKAVILVLTPPKDDNSEEAQVHIKDESLIYTAITRAKEKLFILNLGNAKYHSFFEKYSY